MKRHKFEIVFDDEQDKVELLEFIKTNYREQMNSDTFQLEVKYEIPESQKESFKFLDETVKDIIFVVSSITGVLTPIIFHYLKEKGKKKIKIFNKDTGEKIDITNLSGTEASKVLDSYSKVIEAKRNERK